MAVAVALLAIAGLEHGVGLRQQFRDFADLRLRNRRHLFGVFRGPLLYVFRQFFEAGGLLRDELLVFPAVFHDPVDHAQRQRAVRARTGTQMDIGLSRDAGRIRIDDDELRAALLRAVQEREDMGIRSRAVAADQKDRLRVFGPDLRVHGELAADRSDGARDPR